MAEALVGGALLSGFINVVFERLLSPEAVNLIKGKKLDPELVGRLKTALYAAEAVLMDAEYQQFNKEPVRKWLDSLKDAVYKADDSLDHVFTKAAATQNCQKKVRVSLPRILNFKERRLVSKMVNKIEDDVRRIEDILKYKDVLGLKEVTRDNKYSSSWRTPATSLVRGNIYGREDDQQAIMKMIDEGSDQKLSVIPIVGMGGVGKTTLAQWLYNNEDLKMKGFDLKAWVCVSEPFDIVEVTKTIIEGITNSTCKLKDLNLLQLDLKEKLSSRKFFIVLDDVWNNDRDLWKNFRAPFQYGAEGSTIIVTTRGEDVAKVVQTCSHYSLDGLSEDYCWLVFAEKACLTEPNGRPDLQEIGRRIVNKCNGSPLAAETLGSLLQTERDVKEWEKVLKSDVWNIPVESSKIIPALLISYYHLPAHLKGCFVYCSLFPKDHRFYKDELILLWMAEGLLPPPKGEETLEEVGSECFDKLASRLFFKEVIYEDFVMHDLLHDLSMFLAGDFYCRLEELGEAEKMSIQTRHLSYGSLSHPISKKIDSIDKVESLRTFLPVNFSRLSFSIERTPHIIFSKLKYLRVLSFRSCQGLDTLPDSIGKLIHLRYLDLSYTLIQMLPESLCRLYNLQTLKLRGCEMLNMLPRSMHNLLNLRHLDIRENNLNGMRMPEGMSKLKHLHGMRMPEGMSKLKHLHVLGCFVVHGRQQNSAGNKEELGYVSYFGGTLELIDLEIVANCDEALVARLMNKTTFKLILEWPSGGDIASDMQTDERDIFGKLQPHYWLNELKIKGYRGTRFPNWVGHSSYHNMTRVSLKHCTSCLMLPLLGQLPSLKSLKIEKFEKVEKIGVEFYKNADDPSSSSSASSPFPSLEHLTFRSMPCWEMWSSSDSDNAFPKLMRLQIIDCPRFKGDLPNHLPALEELYLYNSCDSLTLLQLQLKGFPELRKLRIRGCENLESFSLSESPSQGMRSLEVTECMKLKSLPCDMNTLVPNLKSLEIRDCPDIDSFPEGGLPPSLKTLIVKNCEKLLSNLSSMGELESLIHLYINGGDSCLSIKSFPNEGLLPGLPSLTYMCLDWFPNMETLECKELLLRLTSLKHLECKECPKLENIAGERLPHSLIELSISQCPLLAERCKKKHNQIWPKISHIPRIQVDFGLLS